VQIRKYFKEYCKIYLLKNSSGMVIKHNNREHIHLFKDVVSFIYLNIIGKNVIDDKIANEKRSNFF